jgi:hypothetical protein
MDDHTWSRATLWDADVEPPTALFLVTFWDAGTADPPLPAGERTMRVWAATRTGAVAIVQRYFKERGRDFRALGMQLFALLYAMEQWLWERGGLLG